MTKLLTITLFCIMAILFAACGSAGENEPIPSPTPTPMPEFQSICIYTAADLIAQMEALFDADDGVLWGVHLHAPFIFACMTTREAVANMQHNDGVFQLHETGVYLGQLRPGVQIGATVVYVDDRRWGMLPWDWVLDNDQDYILQSMVHEVFHAWQPELFRGIRTGSFPMHMDSSYSRLTARLEINALIYALEASGEERLEAIHDALSIRAKRRYVNAENTGAVESGMEIAEGTAVYTEIRITMRNMKDIIAEIERRLDVHHSDSFISIGYTMGALYGLLLSELGADWKTALRWDSDLSTLLQEAAGITELTPFSELDLEQYGYSQNRR